MKEWILLFNDQLRLEDQERILLAYQIKVAYLDDEKTYITVEDIVDILQSANEILRQQQIEQKKGRIWRKDENAI